MIQSLKLISSTSSCNGASDADHWTKSTTSCNVNDGVSDLRRYDIHLII